MNTQTERYEAQARNTCLQITRLMKASNILGEDHEEVVFQEHKGTLYFDFAIYDMRPETQFQLGALLGGAFGAAAINTMEVKGTNKYRGYIRYEIQTPIKNAK